MKNLLVFVILTLPFVGMGQQITLDPANPGEVLSVESLISLSDGSYVNAGSINTPQALVVRHNDLGTGIAWSKVCNNAYSRAKSVHQASNGNVIVSGWFGNGNSFASAFNPSDGTTVWSKSFSTDSNEVWNSSDFDENGNSYFVGSKDFASSGAGSSDSREIFMKLDASGNIIWARQALRGTNTGSTAEYCYIKGDSLVVVGTSYDGDDTRNGNITVTILNTSNGALIFHKMFGSNDTETFLDAEANEHGIFVLYSINAQSTLALLKINWSLSGSSYPVFTPYSSTYSFRGVVGEVTLNGPDIYISGSMSQSGSQGSFAMKINQAFGVVWTRFINSCTLVGQTYGSAGLGLSGGRTAFVDAKSETGQSVLTTINNSDGSSIAACSSLTALPDVEPSPWSVTAITHSLSLVSLDFSIGEPTFEDYLADIDHCAVLLPAELVSFKAEGAEGKTFLTWQTASERENSHFNVMRSVDESQSFENIGTVTATGNSNQLLGYDFVDESPKVGMNYYKLESVDFDGSVNYSDVVAVRFDESHETFLVYPNPAIAGEAINIKGEFQKVQAYDQLGQEVRTERNGQQLVIQAGPGVYILTIIGASGVAETVRVVTN